MTKSKKAAPAPKAKAEAKIEAGTRVRFMKESGNVHGGSIAELHADGRADLALDDGTKVVGVPRSEVKLAKGAWSPA